MFETRSVSALAKVRFLILALGLLLLAGQQKTSAQTARNNSPPRIVNVGTALYAGIVYVTGYVVDDDDDTEGWSVFLGGDISGVATVGADGRFFFRTPYFLPYGDGDVQTQDPHGAESNVVFFEFQE